MEDRISSLPDEVISHILSFLPTNLAATTSILSKRWKPLWLSLLTLNFDDDTFRSFKSFRYSVSTVFLSRDITLPVKSFYLKCSEASTSNSHYINRFIYTVAQRKIQNLNLQLSIQVNLPPSIFSCRTLVALHLENVKVNDFSHLVVDFPLLKILQLSYIIVESIDNLLRLLYECPILEELHAEYLILNNQDLSLGQKAVKKRFPILPNLIRANIIGTCSNLKRSIIMICWPMVQVLRVAFESQLFDCYRRFYNVTCLKLILTDNHCEKWLCLLESLKYCPKLQNLTISQDYVNVEEVVDNWMEPEIIPECFSTQLRTCLIEGWKYTECGLQFAMYIMKNSKVMNRMSIKSAFSSLSENVKHQMLMKLASGTRASSTCKLYFEVNSYLPISKNWVELF